MEINNLNALSPLDGRYQSRLGELRQIASEFGLIYNRLVIEIRWLKTLADMSELTGLPPPDAASHLFLENLIKHFDLSAAQEIKTIEKTTNHDVKAVEYYLHNKIKNNAKLKPFIPFIHFGCTSEDINNLAYGLNAQ